MRVAFPVPTRHAAQRHPERMWRRGGHARGHASQPPWSLTIEARTCQPHRSVAGEDPRIKKHIWMHVVRSIDFFGGWVGGAASLS